MNTLNFSNPESPHESIVNAFIALKERGFTILNQRSETLDAGQSTHSVSPWAQNLRRFISDPYNCPYDLYGYGFEFMTFMMMRRMYPYLSTLPTPAEWDFIAKRSPFPSADLVAGYGGDGNVKAAFFIRTSLREEAPSIIHPLAGVPLIGITAKQIMGRKDLEKTIFRFATVDFETFCRESQVPNRLAGVVDAKLQEIT